MQSMSTSATSANSNPEETPLSTARDFSLTTNVPIKLDRYDLNNGECDRRGGEHV